MARVLICSQVPAQITPARKNDMVEHQQSSQRTHYRSAHVGGLRGKIRFIESATQQRAGGPDHLLSPILRVLRVSPPLENQQNKKGGENTDETISLHYPPPAYARPPP